MGIKFVSGDIFRRKTHAIVDPVNCMGVQETGLNRVFKNMFPAYSIRYRNRCKWEGLSPGEVFVVENREMGFDYIISLPINDHFRNPSALEHVESGLKALKKACEEHVIVSCAVPALGCGSGGLDWDDVKQVMADILSDSQTCFLCYEPHT